jgi:hypothetical protein
MRAMDEMKSSVAVANFIARPRLMLGVMIFCAGVTLLTVDAASTLYR